MPMRRGGGGSGGGGGGGGGGVLHGYGRWLRGRQVNHPFSACSCSTHVGGVGGDSDGDEKSLAELEATLAGLSEEDRDMVTKALVSGALGAPHNDDDTNHKAAARTGDGEEIIGAKHGGPKMVIVFTCTVCDERSMRTFTKKSYEEGVVLIRCPKCDNLHLIAVRAFMCVCACVRKCARVCVEYGPCTFCARRADGLLFAVGATVCGVWICCVCLAPERRRDCRNDMPCTANPQKHATTNAGSVGMVRRRKRRH